MCPLFLNGLGYVSNGNCISKRKHGNINKKKMNSCQLLCLYLAIFSTLSCRKLKGYRLSQICSWCKNILCLVHFKFKTFLFKFQCNRCNDDGLITI